MQQHRKPARPARATFFKTAAAISIIAVLSAGGTASAQPKRPAQSSEDAQAFSIPSQPLASALIAVAQQANLILIAPRELVDGKTAPALEGDFTTAGALARLLEDSGLGFEITADRRLVLRSGGNAGENDRNPGGGRRRLDEVQEADTRSRAAAGATPRQAEEAEAETAFQLEEIVVTGSHIRGAEPVGAKLIVLGRPEIENTGFGTTQEVLQSLPQFSQIGANEDTLFSLEGRGTSNFSAGSSVNLRGLGADSTLTLLNGRRLPRGGFGSFVDISTIPLTAVERIEVVPDGSSALYGSDAVGGVVNVILREDFQGAETSARVATVTEGDVQEFQVGQLFGMDWDDGNALLSYEYYKRDNLKAEDRDFISFDLRPFGGDDFRSDGGNPGNITNFVETCAIPQAQDGTSLSPSDLLCGSPNKVDLQDGADVLPDQERHGVFVSGRQTLGRWLDVFIEGRYSQRQFSRFGLVDNVTFFVPSSNPFFVDPFGGAAGVFVQRSIAEDLGRERQSGKVKASNVASGATIELPAAWQAEIYGSYAREHNLERFANAPNQFLLAQALADPDPQTAFNPFADGSNTPPGILDRVRGFTSSDQTFELWQIHGKADGRLFSLPGGDARLAIGGEYREESLAVSTTVLLSTPEPDTNIDTAQKRTVKAVFGEFFLPLVSEANAVPGIQRLEISAAGRIEDYSDFGTTADPKVGFRWSPIGGLSLRGSFGTSFKAPILTDLNEDFQLTILDFVLEDPASPSGFTTIVGLIGSNPDLGPEEGRSWTAGVDFTPRFMPGLTLSASYFNIEIDNRILGAVNELFTILIEAERFAARIERNPDIAAVEALFNDPRFQNLFGSAPEDVGALVDLRLRNIGSINTSGVDFLASYGLDTDIGRFEAALNGSVFTKFTQAENPTSPAFPVLGIVRNPARWRMRNSISWSNGGISAVAFVNHTSGLTDDESAPARKVESWTTVDMTLSYRTDSEPPRSWVRDITLSLSVQNLFDTDPPFVNNRRGLGFDPQNASPLGRFIAFRVAKSF